MNARHVAAIMTSVMAALTAAPAVAQSQSDIGRAVTDGAQIEAAIARSEATVVDEEDDQEIDGEAGVYVLRKADIFFVGGEAGLSYSTNPLRTIDDVGASGATEARLDMGVQTLIAETINFSAALGFADTRYFEDFAPSNSVASGNVAVGTGLGKTPLFVGVSAFGGWNFDDNLRSATGFYGGSAQVGAVLPLGRQMIVQPLLVVSRVQNEVSENDNFSLGFRASIVRRTGRLTLSLNAAATRFWFDDFFEDVTFVARNDWQYEGGITASYALGQNLAIAGSVRYVKRDSSFFLSAFDSIDGSAGVSLVRRF